MIVNIFVQSWLIWATFYFCFIKSSPCKVRMWRMFLPNSFQKCRSRHLKMFFRSSCPEVSCKKAVLRDFTKFTGKYLHQNLFVNNVAGQGQQHCFKKRPWHKCFLWILWNLGEHLFLQNNSGGYFKFFKIDVLINFLIFTRKYLCWCPLLTLLEAWKPTTLIKRRPQYKCFPVNITKLLRIAVL